MIVNNYNNNINLLSLIESTIEVLSDVKLNEEMNYKNFISLLSLHKEWSSVYESLKKGSLEEQKMADTFNYKSYSEIPEQIKEYMLVVTGEVSIENVSLDDINTFLNGLFEWEKEIAFEEIAIRSPNRNYNLH